MSEKILYMDPMTGQKRLVKQGWSWFAFLLPGLWMLSNKMWAGFFIYGTFSLLFGWFFQYATKNAKTPVMADLSFLVVLAIFLAFHLIFGLKGSELLNKHLESIGWRKTA